jgi:hypothetical protein
VHAAAGSKEDAGGPPAHRGAEVAGQESGNEVAAGNETAPNNADGSVPQLGANADDHAGPVLNGRAGLGASNARGRPGTIGKIDDLLSSGANRADIVARDLSPDALERARVLGFEKTSGADLNSGAKLTALKAPKGMGADAARRLLIQQMPLGKFFFNHRYAIFPGSKAPGSDVPASSVPSAGVPDPRPNARPRGASPESPDDLLGQPEDRLESADGNTTDVAARAPDESAGPDGGCKGDQCFGPKLIHWSKDLNSCAKDVRIGIIDTSFDISHPAFGALKAKSGDFLDGETPSAYDWHGTAVLSVLAGDPRSGTPGLVPNASYYLATAFKTDEKGNASTDTMRLLKALDWLDKFGVQYVNMSFSGPRDEAFEKAIDEMSKKGVVFVAAAGNQGPTAPPSYPAAYSQVIAVTAVNKKLENYRHANRGTYVDVAAPGVEIWTALPDSREGYRTGTSFAAPFMTAVVAAGFDAKPGNLPKAELLNHLNLHDLGPAGRDPIYGRGLVQAPKSCVGSVGNMARQETLAPAQLPTAAATPASW